MRCKAQQQLKQWLSGEPKFVLVGANFEKVAYENQCILEDNKLPMIAGLYKIL
jgi:hypothetical protein